MKFSIIAAVDQNFGLGKENQLVWRLPADLKHFSKITTAVGEPDAGDIPAPTLTNAVIMGRRTWESLPAKSKPLKNRINVILSRGEAAQILDAPAFGPTRNSKNNPAQNPTHSPGIITANSLDNALAKLEAITNLAKIFVIGGGKVYQEAINHPACEKIYITHIHAIFDCDTFFPKIDPQKFTVAEKSPLQNENGLDFEFVVYVR